MYFSDAHEELRLHIRRFLEKEVQPHLEEWEEKTFPDSIFLRFGELGFLGIRYPLEYGGQGGDGAEAAYGMIPGLDPLRKLNCVWELADWAR